MGLNPAQHTGCFVRYGGRGMIARPPKISQPVSYSFSACLDVKTRHVLFCPPGHSLRGSATQIISIEFDQKDKVNYEGNIAAQPARPERQDGRLGLQIQQGQGKDFY